MYRAASAAFFITKIMAKDRESITIDKKVNEGIKEEAKKQRRSFSGMIEYVCNEYLMSLKKPKSEGKKK